MIKLMLFATSIFLCVLPAHANPNVTLYQACITSFDEEAEQLDALRSTIGVVNHSALMRTHADYTLAACKCTRDNVEPTLSAKQTSYAVRYFKDARSLRRFSDQEVLQFNRKATAINSCISSADKETGMSLKLQQAFQ